MENRINSRLLSMAGQGGSAFGITLMELMEERNDIIVLSADMSTPAGLDKFKTAYPDNFINVGIAEQNMIGMAAGLAEEGFKVICVAQACFITMRCFEQIRQYAGYMGIPMILVGIGSGLSLQYMGNTHYSLEDIALMRTINNMKIVAPCDSLEAMKALELSVKYGDSCYIRLFGGTGIPVVHQTDIDFQLGKAITLKEGNDVAILATGSMVTHTLKAAELLELQGIGCSVIDVHSIKPLDENSIATCLDKKMLVTVEEHRRTGGLGTAVADYLANHKIAISFKEIGVNDTNMLPGSYQYMLYQCGLSANQIALTIKSAL